MSVTLPMSVAMAVPMAEPSPSHFQQRGMLMRMFPIRTARYRNERNLCMFIACWIMVPSVWMFVQRQVNISSNAIQ